jgi:hypothetical protein
MITLIDFAERVFRMRQAQRRHSATGSQTYLAEAKAAESEVDALLARVQGQIDELNRKLKESPL